MNLNNKIYRFYHLHFRPLEVQFFSSATSVVILVPICYLTVDMSQETFGLINIFLFIINGVSFHMQTLLAFTLMSYISPVTYRYLKSVTYRLKEAFFKLNSHSISVFAIHLNELYLYGKFYFRNTF